ncbi:oligosaccharide flippase family protein [Rhodococcus sp. DMU2021]|uniref:oligosaccharide flippase family protein n=1 Tax=Rhodococcus sp. DMU2021 TaxID=2866997 RepID=UPI001C7DB9CD|nr:oligosaccharide flippase family protein [Rhodococcus sp. DMU2021]MBX4170569.1 oligosaccharide flippase family protein [Rhodococcus sp. DMU2021]
MTATLPGALERGRLPMVLSMVMSAALAVITALRFVVLVQFLTPDDYGRINIFATLTSVVPLLMSLGMSVQYQRVARAAGSKSLRTLTRTALVVNALTTLPTFVIVLLIAHPLSGPEGYVLPAILAVVISAATSIATLYSQTALGLGYRTTASGMLFLVNACGAVPLVPIWISETASVTSVLAWWAAGAAIACVLSRAILPSKEMIPVDDLDPHLSYREGIYTLPVQVGPWLILFLVRYIIGLNIDTSAIAAFAVASTVADMGFLVASAALGFFSNRLMSNQITPARALLFTTPVLLAVTAGGGAIVYLFLPIIGKGGDYEFPVAVSIILAMLSLTRLYISAWRPRIVGLRRLHSTSWVYFFCIGTISVALFTMKPATLAPYAWISLAAFVLIAGVQRSVVRQAEA